MNNALGIIDAELPVGPVDGVGSLFKQSWGLYFRHFWRIALYVAAPFLPAFLLLNYFEPWTLSDKHQAFWKFIELADVAAFLSAFTVPAILHAIVQKMRTGKAPGMAADFFWAARRWGAVFGYRFLVGLYLIVGTLLLIVPGVLFMVRYCLVTPLVALDLESGLEPMKAGAALAKNRGWLLFWTGLSLYATGLVITFVVSALVGLSYGFAIRIFSDYPHLALQQNMWVILSLGNTIGIICFSVLTVMTLVACLAWRKQAAGA